MNRNLILSAGLAGILLLGGCASGGVAVGTLDAEQLFAYGQERMEARKWQDAIRAFERFTFEFAAHPRYQEARYLLGEAHFGAREYITAATEFARLAGDFPAGPWVDDARFKVCESYYRLSPRPELDQEYTHGALGHCEALLSYHPDSPFNERAREMMAELTDKLAAKQYGAGAYYERRKALDSAIKYFQATVELFPTTDHAPRALLRLYRIYEELEYRDEAAAARTRLLRDYPTSPEARELEKAVTGHP